MGTNKAILVYGYVDLMFPKIQDSIRGTNKPFEDIVFYGRPEETFKLTRDETGCTFKMKTFYKLKRSTFKNERAQKQ